MGELELPMTALRNVGISGPGTTATGGGFWGGGFGVEGAATGLVIAGVLNALTTKTSTISVLALETATAEVWAAVPGIEPAALRIELSPVFVALRSLQPR